MSARASNMLKGGVPMQEIEQIYTQYRQDVYRYL